MDDKMVAYIQATFRKDRVVSLFHGEQAVNLVMIWWDHGYDYCDALALPHAEPPVLGGDGDRGRWN